MKKTLAVVGATVALVAGGAAVPAFAATPSVQFTKVQYNSPGSDDRSTTSLNAEWVRLTNTTTATINLNGWTVRDKANHVYTFGAYNLGAGKRVYVHTGKGTDGKPDVQHRYQNSGAYIWNNTGDTAYLRNASGRAVDSCAWGSTGSVTYC